MKPKLFGAEDSSSTKKTLVILQDAGVSYEYVETVSDESDTMEALSSITGSFELPQLLVGGESYVGFGAISKYISN